MEINYKPYIDVVRSQLSRRPEQWNFKSNPMYQGILEHVSPTQGHAYLRLCRQQFPHKWSQNAELFSRLCALNDRYGNPRKARYPDFRPCSPTNLRYLYYALLILSKQTQDTLDIIEIGGGYGGLCLFIHKLAPLFNKTISSYTMFDLPEVAQLQANYLKSHAIVSVCTSLGQDVHLQPDSCLISMYALSELPAPLRKQYREKVIVPHCREGFIVWNINPYDTELETDYIVEKSPEAVSTASTGNFEVTLMRKTVTDGARN